MRRLVACLNGNRSAGSHPALPVTPAQLAADTLAVLAAGATEVHVHPRAEDGTESPHPFVVGAVLRAIRAASPGTKVSVTTKLAPGADPGLRAELISGWTVLPDMATVNMHEPGAVELAAALIDRGVRVEAGLWTEEAALLFAAAPAGLAARCSYVLLEPMEATAGAALRTAQHVQRLLDDAGLTAAPRMLHGDGGAAWPVFAAAAAGGRLDLRMGLEDTFTRPDGSTAADNAELLAAAAMLARGDDLR